MEIKLKVPKVRRYETLVPSSRVVLEGGMYKLKMIHRTRSKIGRVETHYTYLISPEDAEYIDSQRFVVQLTTNNHYKKTKEKNVNIIAKKNNANLLTELLKRKFSRSKLPKVLFAKFKNGDSTDWRRGNLEYSANNPAVERQDNLFSYKVCEFTTIILMDNVKLYTLKKDKKKKGKASMTYFWLEKFQYIYNKGLEDGRKSLNTNTPKLS